MPYEGEFAGYRSIRRLVGADAVQQLLKRAESHLQTLTRITRLQSMRLSLRPNYRPS